MILSRTTTRPIPQYRIVGKGRITGRMQPLPINLRRRHNVETRYGGYGVENALVDASYFVGKGIILYTMFYCSLNWLFYKRLRESQEKRDDDNNKKK